MSDVIRLNDDDLGKNAMKFAEDSYEGVTHAGIAVVRRDGGTAVFLAQRSMDETDAPDVQETWEFPGGGLKAGEEPLMGAMREFSEEIGFDLPPGEVTNGWRSEDGVYQGFVYEATEFPAINDWTPTSEVQAVGWFTREEAEKLALRPEMKKQFDWSLLDTLTVSGNEHEEPSMADNSEMTDMDQDDIEILFATPIPIHGVLAPEGTESGDARGFNEGAITARPYRLPFRWQKTDIGAHDGAVTIGSVDRLMRADGLIHFEGLLMPSDLTEEFINLLMFFGNRYGVSVDGDRGSLDSDKTKATGVTWFDAARAAGLTGVAIPAFAEAYVSLGPHPDMPAIEDEAAMMASGALLTFDRGPGWVTNPKETKRLHDYWTKKGEPGYAKIRWGTPGDFTRAKKLIGEKIGANSPEDLRFLNQIIAQWHYDALGYWPGDLDKPGNKTTAEARAERKAKAAASLNEGWAQVLTSAGWCDIAEELFNEGVDSGRIKEVGLREDGAILWTLDGEFDLEDETTREIVTLTASVVTANDKVRALPPASYFDKHPDTGALVIEDPDENGLRRTYGYAGEWGVCHIGYDGQCVGVPEDSDGSFPEFHLGRTRVSGNEYLNTGLITYKVDHRDAETILSQSAEQQHFDNIAHAWAAVRLGQDEFGIWFSGVVLPGIPEDDIVLIEAAGQVSGEWKYGDLRALQAVNVPGFPVMRSSAAYDDAGNVIALVASAHNLNGCEPSPAERMAALAQVDAEVRFAQLKSEFTGQGA